MKIKTIDRDDLKAKYSLKEFAISHTERSWGGKKPDLIPISRKKKIALVKFNGCLHLIKKYPNYCDYYMAYRCSKPHSQMKKVADRPRDILNPTLWDVYFKAEWDGTGLARLRIYDDLSIKVLQDSVPVKSGAWKLDSRIVKRNGKFYFIHNIFTDKNTTGGSKFLQNCDKGDECCYMIKQEINILKGGGYSCTGLRPEVICKTLHYSIEKNWSIINDPKLKNDYYHVAFQPQFKFIKKDLKTGVCRVITPHKSNFFDKLQKYFYPILDKWFSISCTTPLIDYDKTSWIGVGHLKLKYKEKIPGSRPKLKKFFDDLESRLGISGGSLKRGNWEKYSPDVHHAYIYCAFLYTVDKKTLNFKKCSDAFTPTDSQRCYVATIGFPMSITPFTGNNFLISLGLSDIDQAFLKISRSEINQRLKFNNNSKPSKFGFSVENAIMPM